MNKLLTFFTMGVLALSSMAQDEVFYKADFEDFSDDTLSKAYFNQAQVSEASGENILSGKGSLVLDTMGQKGWPLSIRFLEAGIPNNSIYRIKFKYKVLELPEGGQLFLIVQSWKKDGDGRFLTRGFGDSVGESGTLEAVAMVTQNSDERIVCEITSRGGAKIVIDDVVITRSDLPEYGKWFFEKDAFIGMRNKPSEPAFAVYNPQIFKISKEKFFPFVDKYGQFKHGDWKEKIKSDADFKKRINEEDKFFAKNPVLADRDEFGGIINPNKNYGKSSRFKLTKVRGKWFFVTPKGNLFWSQGIDSTGAQVTTPVDRREFYFEDISDKNFYQKSWWGKFEYEKPHMSFRFSYKNYERKYGDDFMNKAFARIEERVKHWGINTFGAWSAHDLIKRQNVAYSFIFNSTTPCVLDTNSDLEGYWSKPADYFDPKFESATMKAAQENADFIKSPYCIGVFVDNELPWQREPLTLPKAVLTCPENQPAKVAMWDMLKTKHGEIANLNKAWGAKYSDWDAFLKERAFVPTTKESEYDLWEFETKFYERYFEVCSKAVKSIDPDALYMGCRLAWTNQLIGQVASRMCDVVSYNLYRDNVADFKLPEGSKDTPVIIGEYHFGAAVRGVMGCGLKPKNNMDEVAEAYYKYTLSAIENPIIVGAHWFQWSDQACSGRSDGENYTIGFVDICDTPVYPLVISARKIADELYPIRLSAKKTVKALKEKAFTY